MSDIIIENNIFYFKRVEVEKKEWLCQGFDIDLIVGNPHVVSFTFYDFENNKVYCEIPLGDILQNSSVD